MRRPAALRPAVSAAMSSAPPSSQVASPPVAAADPAPFYAIGAGTLLILTGAAGYLLSEKASPVTALIPAVPGLILIVCGLIARTGEKALKHAMHAAAAVGLLGGLAAVAGMVARWEKATVLALGTQAAMAVICFAFVALCVKSFRDARKRREAAAA